MQVMSLLPAERILDAPIPAGWSVVSPPQEEWHLAIAQADFLLGGMTRIDEHLIGAAESLRLIQLIGAGANGVEIEAARRRGVPVCNNPGHNDRAVAEYVLMAILYLARHIGESMQAIWQDEFAEVKIRLARMPVRQLEDLSVGILGMGRSGRAVAALLRSCGIGRLCVWSRSPLEERLSYELGVEQMDLDQLLGSVDVVTVHLPLTADTRLLLSADKLTQMRPGSILINTARGEIVDEEALAWLLENEHLQGAAVDVYSEEPPLASHPLLSSPKLADKVMLTPHVAGVTSRSWSSMLEAAFANMIRVAEGLEPLNRVDTKC